MKHKVELTDKIREYIDIPIDTKDIVISETSLIKHMVNHNHENCLKYIPNIQEILTLPDFIGKNRNVKGVSFECIKVYDDNVLVAVKLENKKGYFYVASMYDVTSAKLEWMEKSKRIKRVDG